LTGRLGFDESEEEIDEVPEAEAAKDEYEYEPYS
jgi:hypothetical protein